MQLLMKYLQFFNFERSNIIIIMWISFVIYPNFAVFTFNPALAIAFVRVVVDLTTIQAILFQLESFCTLRAEMHVLAGKFNLDSFQFSLEGILAKEIMTLFVMRCLQECTGLWLMGGSYAYIIGVRILSPFQSKCTTAFS